MYKNKVTKHLYFDTINEFQIDKSHSLILHSSSTSETIILLDKIEIKSSLQKKLKQSVNSHQSKNITAKLLGKNVYYSICYMAFFNHFITDNSILTAIFFMIMPTYIAYLFIQYFLIKGKSEINSQLEEKLLVKEKGKQ
ncbi:hypothetical protein [Flammeovirga kamogawensis]|nr:hypothetical protein [Flammeovirga kamogawensis]